MLKVLWELLSCFIVTFATTVENEIKQLFLKYFVKDENDTLFKLVNLFQSLAAIASEVSAQRLPVDYGTDFIELFLTHKNIINL